MYPLSFSNMYPIREYLSSIDAKIIALSIDREANEKNIIEALTFTDLSYTDLDGLLIVACNNSYRYKNLILYLVDRGANVNTKSVDGKTPLCLFSDQSDLDLFKHFVEILNADIGPVTDYLYNNPVSECIRKYLFYKKNDDFDESMGLFPDQTTRGHEYSCHLAEKQEGSLSELKKQVSELKNDLENIKSVVCILLDRGVPKPKTELEPGLKPGLELEIELGSDPEPESDYELIQNDLSD